MIHISKKFLTDWKKAFFLITFAWLSLVPPAGADGAWFGNPPSFQGTSQSFSWRWKTTVIPHHEFTEIGQPAPVALEDFHGKVILLNVWATWCPPCVAEMPALDALQEMRGGEDFAVIALSVDSRGPEVVTEFLTKHGLDHLTPYIGHGRDTFDHFKMQELPTTFLLGRDGKVWGTLAGSAEWDSPEALALIDYAIGLKPNP